MSATCALLPVHVHLPRAESSRACLALTEVGYKERTKTVLGEKRLNFEPGIFSFLHFPNCIV